MSTLILGMAAPKQQPKNSISTQTSKCTDITNLREDPSEQPLFLKERAEAILSKYPGTTVRIEPTVLYNCHGMTFANRRTGIYESCEIDKIIKDDNYIEKTLADSLPGDIVIYYSEKGDVEHSGLVVQGVSAGIIFPIVLSKWGSLYEVIHSLHSCPYDLRFIKFYRCHIT